MGCTNSFYNSDELKEIGFKSIGYNVYISRKASLYGVNDIQIGNNVRIDDFCILSASDKGIKIGNFVHIACLTSIIGSELIDIKDFAGISSHCSIYSSSDDFSGNSLTGPTVPNKYRNVSSNPVVLEKHAVIGAGCVLLPGVIIGHGTAIGAMSLVTENCDPHSIYSGIPAKFLKKRKTTIDELEKAIKKNLAI